MVLLNSVCWKFKQHTIKSIAALQRQLNGHIHITNWQTTSQHPTALSLALCSDRQGLRLSFLPREYGEYSFAASLVDGNSLSL